MSIIGPQIPKLVVNVTGNGILVDGETTKRCLHPGIKIDKNIQ